MKGFFNTSVLVPVFCGDHVHHKASLELFIQFDNPPAAAERTVSLKCIRR